MKLVCRTGETAMYVGPCAASRGMVVVTQRLSMDYGRPAWYVTPNLSKGDGGRVDMAFDAHLCPIRDSDGEDEVLRMVGRPVGTPQAA